jgi:hypothetical protein
MADEIPQSPINRSNGVVIDESAWIEGERGAFKGEFTKLSKCQSKVLFVMMHEVQSVYWAFD